MKKMLSVLLCAVMLVGVFFGAISANAASDEVNGFKAFETGGLVGGTDYDANITLNDCGGTDRVLVTGRGGTNYGDPNNPRSTMGVYSTRRLQVDKLEILYSVEQWITSGDHWYAFALTKEIGNWYEDDGSDNALFFMFQYVNGNVILKPHHIGNGAGWTYLGDTVGVPAVGGQYSIYIEKTDAGYVVSMKNAEQTEYTPQITIDSNIVEGLFPDGDACLMAGAYVATYSEQWAFVLGAHEAEVEPPEDPTTPVEPEDPDDAQTTEPSGTTGEPEEPDEDETTEPSGTTGEPEDSEGASPKTGDTRMIALCCMAGMALVALVGVTVAHRRRIA